MSVFVDFVLNLFGPQCKRHDWTTWEDKETYNGLCGPVLIQESHCKNCFKAVRRSVTT